MTLVTTGTAHTTMLFLTVNNYMLRIYHHFIRCITPLKRPLHGPDAAPREVDSCDMIRPPGLALCL
jgi:hypothetical protein